VVEIGNTIVDMRCVEHITHGRDRSGDYAIVRLTGGSAATFSGENAVTFLAAYRKYAGLATD
jgi:hypothetical protein